MGAKRDVVIAVAERHAYMAAGQRDIDRRAERLRPGGGLKRLAIGGVGELVVPAAVTVPDVDEIDRQPLGLRGDKLLGKPLRKGGIVLDVGARARVAGAGFRDGKRLALLLGELDQAVEALAVAATAVERPFRRRGIRPVVRAVDRVGDELSNGGIFLAGRPVVVLRLSA